MSAAASEAQGPAGPGRARRGGGPPNPVWLREMRQFSRLTRTPFLLMTLTVLLALLLCAIGGIASMTASPASIGAGLHHTFFSIAFFVVTLAGPALAANGIASEREGRTWEALLLTGLAPGVIARGKFLAAYTHVALYVVMLAPVGALPFLFGGVTAVEVVLAFVWLFLFALLAVAFGLAVSSKMDSLRVALLVTLLCAFLLSPTAYGIGTALSHAAHLAWPAVPDALPVWLPTAYERAPFSLAYLGALVALPLGAVALPSWFLYEVTVANLTSVTDDRSTGVRRWFFVTSAALTATGLALVAQADDASDAAMLAMGALLGYFFYLVFCAFVFAGEPIGPSRRVVRGWERARAGALQRFLGPGVVRASVSLLFAGLGGLSALTAAGFALSYARPASPLATPPHDAGAVLIFGAYALGFSLFAIGFGAWVRARAGSPAVARVLLLVALLVVTAGPWLGAAIAGVLSRDLEAGALLFAAPSPSYAFVAADQVRSGSARAGSAVAAAGSCAAIWAVLGLTLLARAGGRCRAIIAAHDEALARGDALLADEDARAARAARAGG
ncbi:MAG TPA: ABC transporter permease [Polyangiaceae bacterium]|nr:ABC transporter permease [Polyangiaceae bacterium]